MALSAIAPTAPATLEIRFVVGYLTINKCIHLRSRQASEHRRILPLRAGLTTLSVMKEVIRTDRAPEAIGPYSQAVRVGDFVFCSGQVAINPATQEMVTGGIEAETRQVLENLQAVVQAAGLTLQHVVKTTVYLADFADYPTVNAIYAEFFKGDAPARAAVAVKTLPKNARVEIDAIVAAH